jgi:hypothetical protein
VCLFVCFVLFCFVFISISFCIDEFVADSVDEYS